MLLAPLYLRVLGSVLDFKTVWVAIYRNKHSICCFEAIQKKLKSGRSPLEGQRKGKAYLKEPEKKEMTFMKVPMYHFRSKPSELLMEAERASQGPGERSTNEGRKPEARKHGRHIATSALQLTSWVILHKFLNLSESLLPQP